MIKKIRNLDINYVQYGEGDDVVLLHGWGQNIKMMEPLGNNLSQRKKITILDFPGFGSSQTPDFAYTIYDYTELLHDLLNELKIEKPTLIGHSFGGRVAICYAAKYEVNKLVLMGSPFRSLQKNGLKVKMLKQLKKIPVLKGLAEEMKKHMGSADYKAAQGVMRDILVNTVNANLESDIKKIKAETLLIWGDNDEQVPLSEARVLDDMLQDSALITLNGSHYCYLENLMQVVSILEHFI